MANEGGHVYLWYDGSSAYDLWLNDDSVSSITLGSGTRAKLTYYTGDYLRVYTTITATTHGAILTTQVADYDGTAVTGARPLRVLFHDGSYNVVNATLSSIASGTTLATTAKTGDHLVFTDAAGKSVATFDFGAAVNNAKGYAAVGPFYGQTSTTSIA